MIPRRADLCSSKRLRGRSRDLPGGRRFLDSSGDRSHLSGRRRSSLLSRRRLSSRCWGSFRGSLRSRCGDGLVVHGLELCKQCNVIKRCLGSLVSLRLSLR